MQVEIREVPPRHVAYLRAMGRYPQTFPKLWPKLHDAAAPLELFGKGLALSIMHDPMGTVADEQLRGDAAIEIPADWQPQNGLLVQDVPGGLHATTQHHGPYELLGETWGSLLGKWRPASGYVVRPAPMYEVYVSDPSNVAPHDLITELYLPVRRI